MWTDSNRGTGVALDGGSESNPLAIPDSRTAMKTTSTATLTMRCELEEMTARDLMSENPVFIRVDATDEEAIRFLADKGISGVVVIGDAGRPLGVLTATDVLIHQRAKLTARHKYDPAKEPTLVKDLMTPAVFSVRLDASAREVIAQMTALNVHRLFVVDET